MAEGGGGGGGGGRNQRTGQKFCDLLSWGGGGRLFLGGAIFFKHVIFANFFFAKVDITCIITVVEAQKQHKGMYFFKHEGGGGTNFFNSVMGRGDFFPVYFRLGRGGVFSPIDFAEPPHPPDHKMMNAP